jgi:hypothetical protein
LGELSGDGADPVVLTRMRAPFRYPSRGDTIFSPWRDRKCLMACMIRLEEAGDQGQGHLAE